MLNPTQSYSAAVELVCCACLKVKSIQVEAADLDFPTIPGMADSPVLAVLNPAEPFHRDVAVSHLVSVAP